MECIPKLQDVANVEAKYAIIYPGENELQLDKTGDYSKTWDDFAADLRGPDDVRFGLVGVQDPRGSGEVLTICLAYIPEHKYAENRGKCELQFESTKAILDGEISGIRKFIKCTKPEQVDLLIVEAELADLEPPSW